MGGGGGKAPEPKKFVAPPIDNSPATNPIPNFFANRAPGGQMPMSPYQQFGGMTPPQSPFGGQQLTPEMIEALLKKIRGGR
jgi:hypothetical protein